jgi:hypothetical protein
MSSFFPKIRLWPGKNLSVDPASWGLGVDITSYVRQPGQDGGQVITYSNGRQDEGNQIDAGTMNLTLDNRTGIWSPKNVNGTYYGQLGRNTPIQLQVDTASDDFTRTAAGTLGTATSGQLWVNTASWSRNGTSAVCQLAVNTIGNGYLTGADAWDFDVRATVSVSVVSTGANLIVGVGGRYLNATDSIFYRCEFNNAGNVDVRIGRYQSALITDLATALAVTTYAANTKIRMRCQAMGTTVRVKVWKPANPALPDADEPAAWTAEGTDGVATAPATGTKLAIYGWRAVGNTNVGTPSLFVDDFASTAIEWTGSVVQWPTRWDKSGNNAWAPIQAAGQLRRLRQGQGKLESPLRRQLSSYEPFGFWPLEDDTGSTQFESAVANRQPGIGDRVTPGGDTTLPGAFRAVTMNAADSSISFRTARTGAPGSIGFAVMFLFKLSSLPGGTTRLCRIYPTGTMARWEFTVSDTALGIQGFLPGDSVVNQSATISMAAIINPTEWVAVQLETALGGGLVSWDFIAHQVGNETYYGDSGSYATTSTAPPVVTQATLGGTLLNGAAFSMLYIGDETLPFVDSTFSLVSAGYEGELAADRMRRIATETGLPIDVESGDSEPMGAQREGTALEVLRSCESADYGILYEARDGRLGYRPRAARYNPASLLTLSMVAGHINEAPDPIYDDQRLRNVWTISRVGGSSATVANDASVALDGEIAGSDSINVEQDAALTQHAAWRTYLGTQEDLRWPNIVINFGRTPALIPYWLSRTYGFRFGVSTGLVQVAGSEGNLIAEGYQAEIWPDGWKVTLNCTGASPWDIAVLESATAPVRADTEGCVLTEDIDATETAWDVTTTSGPIWNPATTFPILMQCEGEIISVSAIVTGVSPAQTLTVTRSVNGVIKTHPTGAAVSLAYPSRVAL